MLNGMAVANAFWGIVHKKKKSSFYVYSSCLPLKFSIFKKKLFIYLFLAALGLSFIYQASL